MAQRMRARQKLLDLFLDMGAELFGLGLGVAELEAHHAELFLGIREIVGGELSDAPKTGVRGQRLAVSAEDFHDFVGEPDPHFCPT